MEYNTTQQVLNITGCLSYDNQNNKQTIKTPKNSKTIEGH